MKFLDANTLIALLPADPAEVDPVLRDFEIAVPTEYRGPGYCKRAIKEGLMTGEHITANGRPSHLVCHHMTDDAGLYVDVAVSLSPIATSAMLSAGVDLIARRNGARYIRLATRRAGFVRAAQPFGYKPEAILLLKGVTPCS